jgi:BirA family biotin operon repressor/biotin-[acetyl-CoA-carboxylase] ligase
MATTVAPDTLEAAAIRSGLESLGVGLVVELCERCTSTNTLLLERSAEGVPALLFAEEQTAGRGRRGRRWHAERGAALMLSLRWHFRGNAGRLGGLSLAAGVGVARALRELGAHGVCLKWPNDLLAPATLGGGKLGGILVETRASGASIAVVVGVGLNCRRAEGLEGRLRRRVASLDELLHPLPGRNEIATRVAAGLAGALGSFENAGFEAFRQEWEAMHANQGETMKVRTPDGRVISGIADGLAADGGLLLRTRRGVQAIRTGSVVRGRAA